MTRDWERAARGGDADALRRMIAAGADVDARNRHGQTALMLAAHRGHRTAVETLIEAGARLDAVAKFNLTALMLAIVAGHAEVALALVRAGADRSVRGTGSPGFAGKTARDLARARPLPDVAAALDGD